MTCQSRDQHSGPRLQGSATRQTTEQGEMCNLETGLHSTTLYQYTMLAQSIMQVITLKVPQHTTKASAKFASLTTSSTTYCSFGWPLKNAGSHADASEPIGGYLCPSCSIRGPHTHHCSEGTLSMTPATCLPQPHHVVLSRADSTLDYGKSCK